MTMKIMCNYSRRNDEWNINEMIMSETNQKWKRKWERNNDEEMINNEMKIMAY